MVKNLPANAGGTGDNPWARKIPWKRKCQPTPVFLPGEFPGQRSLVYYSPWGCKESDTTEWLTLLLLLRKHVLKTKKKGKEVFNMHLLNDRDMQKDHFSCTHLHDTSPSHPQDTIAGVGMGKIAPFLREECVKDLQLRQFLWPALPFHLLFPFILTRILVVCKIEHQL